MLSTLVPGSLSSSFGHSRSTGTEVRPSDFAVNFLELGREAQAIGRINGIEILSVIGQGDNGIVLKGYQQELNRLVAGKVMAPQLATNAESRKRFGREAQATAAIVHPNVIPMLTVQSAGQLPYLVMPYVDCESLQQRRDREGSLPTVVLGIGVTGVGQEPTGNSSAIEVSVSTGSSPERVSHRRYPLNRRFRRRRPSHQLQLNQRLMLSHVLVNTSELTVSTKRNSLSNGRAS